VGVQISRQIELAAQPEQIGEVLADLPRWPEWFALHKGWVDQVPARAEQGTKFKHRVRILGVPGEIEWKVTEVEFPTRFVLVGKGSNRTGAEIDFKVDPQQQTSLVEFVAQLKGLTLKPFEGMLKPWLEVRAERTVSALRTRVEGFDAR